jgi:probable rRNA maturation factor
VIRAELNQVRLARGKKLSAKRVAQVLAECAKVLQVRKEILISIGFVSSRHMRRLNKQWRGKDQVTDVLSFELGDGPFKGELILNHEQAARQAKWMHHSTIDELCFLIVHGVLHLWGHDHENSRDAKKMFLLQERILRSLNIDPHL